MALGLTMSASRAIAQDLAQETLIRAYRHRGRLADLEAPYAWCRRVMSNLLIDQHRTRTAERSAIRRLASAQESERVSRAAGAQRGVGDDVWAELIEPLTERQRCVATLYYADDHSVADIASDLGLSTGSVKTTLARIRRKVGRHLRERAESEETSG